MPLIAACLNGDSKSSDILKLLPQEICFLVWHAKVAHTFYISTEMPSCIGTNQQERKCFKLHSKVSRLLKLTECFLYLVRIDSITTPVFPWNYSEVTALQFVLEYHQTPAQFHIHVHVIQGCGRQNNGRPIWLDQAPACLQYIKFYLINKTYRELLSVTIIIMLHTLLALLSCSFTDYGGVGVRVEVEISTRFFPSHNITQFYLFIHPCTL